MNSPVYNNDEIFCYNSPKSPELYVCSTPSPQTKRNISQTPPSSPPPAKKFKYYDYAITERQPLNTIDDEKQPFFVYSVNKRQCIYGEEYSIPRQLHDPNVLLNENTPDVGIIDDYGLQNCNDFNKIYNYILVQDTVEDDINNIASVNINNFTSTNTNIATTTAVDQVKNQQKQIYLQQQYHLKKYTNINNSNIGNSHNKIPYLPTRTNRTYILHNLQYSDIPKLCQRCYNIKCVCSVFLSNF